MLGYKELIRKYKINNLVETEHIIEKQRMIKDEEEIGYIEKACKITDACFSHLLNFIKIGRLPSVNIAYILYIIGWISFLIFMVKNTLNIKADLKYIWI